MHLTTILAHYRSQASEPSGARRPRPDES